MGFILLTAPEAEGAVIRWQDDAPKPPELVAAAVAAGFNETEVAESPLGVLGRDFRLGPVTVFRRGARALIGINGTTLIETP